jgi:hypothetical protein
MIEISKLLETPRAMVIFLDQILKKKKKDRVKPSIEYLSMITGKCVYISSVELNGLRFNPTREP